MEETLTIKQTAKILNLSYGTVFAKKHDWGFFEIKGIRGWRIFKSVLEKQIEENNNIHRLKVMVGDQEKKLCRSEKTKTVFGKSTLPHRTASEFDVLVKRLRKS